VVVLGMLKQRNFLFFLNQTFFLNEASNAKLHSGHFASINPDRACYFGYYLLSELEVTCNTFGGWLYVFGEKKGCILFVAY
jgi:hypothetical protein